MLLWLHRGGHRSAMPGTALDSAPPTPPLLPLLMLVTLYPSLLEALTMSFIDVSKLWIIPANHETFGGCGNPSTCSWRQKRERSRGLFLQTLQWPTSTRHPQGHPNKAQFFTGAFMSHMARPCCLSTFTHGASPSLVLPGSCQPLGSSLHTPHLPASAPFSNLLLRAGMLSPRVLLEFLSGIPDLAKPVPLILFKIAPTPLAVSVEWLYFLLWSYTI